LSERSGALDERAARRRFERAARSYAGASRLEAEVGARMLERLDYVRIAPQRILDAGSGPAREASALKRRYPGAELIALDYALGMLPRPGRLARWLARAVLPVCGELARLPLADESVGLLWSNMALHWVNDPLVAFREFARVLAPEGLLLFSTLGPDSLKELRVAAGATRVHAFTDMHDLGDMLVAAGFDAPVMDMEWLRIDYATPQRLLAGLRASGETNVRADRARGLAGSALLKRLHAAPASASYELVYGHAWKRTAREAVKTVRVFKRIP
jgi:malonyl-CoA O-methyltransferase